MVDIDSNTDSNIEKNTEKNIEKNIGVCNILFEIFSSIEVVLAHKLDKVEEREQDMVCQLVLELDTVVVQVLVLDMAEVLVHALDTVVVLDMVPFRKNYFK